LEITLKNPLRRRYRLPAKDAKEYLYDVLLEEESRAIFEQRWQKYRPRLVPKRPNAQQKRCSAFLKQIQKTRDDGPEAKNVAIRWISKRVGYGVFARKRIRAGTILGFYGGVLRHIPPSREKAFLNDNYLFGFQGHRELMNFSIDAKEFRNFTAFFNHAHYKSSGCNLEPTFHFAKDLPRIVFVATRTIEKDEQLCYDYGDSYWEDLGYSPVDWQ
jgi:SET domain-containing protein